MNVVPLEWPVEQNVVDFLRDALEKAERGELRFALVVGMTHDGGVIDGWSAVEKMRPYVVVGALECAKKRFMDREIEW